MSPAIHPLYVASGFAIGFLVGMTGVGGGSLMTPLLILLFKVHPVTAVGTDLIYASVTKSGGSLVHGFNRTIDWRVVLRLACGSLPASVATLAMLAWLKIDQAAYSVLVTKMLGVALLFTAAGLLFRRRLLATYSQRVGVLSPAQTRTFTIATGAALGVLVTISSVGAGALGVTALLLLYPELPAVRIAGSDIAHAVPLTLVAGLGHVASGGIDLMVLVSLLMGSLPGIMLASLFAPRLPDRALRLVLSGTLILVAARLLLA
ncbi:MAG: sulfite exporter TauE/SafE family protein [Alphaproteobacteria bacterium]|nr:sulfite exporter TauE/SafE family protein [Alphaproteobacteria bacterium]